MHIDIKFDNFTKMFLAGDEISGEVNVKFEKPETFRKITIEFEGVTKAKWKKFFTKYSGQTRHFKHNVLLYGETFWDVNSVLDAGNHSFRFHYILPAALPSTLEGKYGYTRYFVQAEIVVTRENNLKCTEDITVWSFIALDGFLKAHMPLFIKLEKKIRFDRFAAVIRASCSGFIAGQVLPFTVEVQNFTKYNVKEVHIQIVRNEIFFASRPYYKSKANMVIVKDITLGGISPKSYRLMTSYVQFPILVPTGLGVCITIDVEYFIRIIFNMSGTKSFQTDYSIIVGTKPLNVVASFSNAIDFF